MKSSWPTKKLGEICEENIKSPFKVEDVSNSGEYPFFTSGENVLTHDEYLVDGENIFLATGGYANVKYYNGKASYSTDTWSLKVKNALTKFVFYQILARLKYIDEVLFRGSGLRHLQKKEFLNLEIPLPPLHIQQKIVKILDTIQSAIDIQEKIIEKTKELKKSLMAELFKYGAPSFRKGRKLKKTEIGEIPENWEVVRLEKVVIEMKAGGTPNTSEEKYWGGDIAFTLIEDLVNAGKFLVKTNVSITKLGLKNSSSWVVPENSIILSLYATVGKPVINKIPVAITQNMIGIIPNKEIIDLEFLYYALENVRNKLWKYTDLSVHRHITTSEAKKILIPLPPLPEQQEIAEILQTIDQKIEIEKKKKELYEELFKTILNKIMNQEIDINLLDY
jgi:type I restriction enzyme S subunit